tara:strand:+ start:362 stop:613 length:252 start_codon:yes stop_codon:yes gene_type:complete
MAELRIVYKDTDGTTAIIAPSPTLLTLENPNTGKLWTVDDVAKKDVPKGFKYKIIPYTDVSMDRTFREAWTVDEADLTDGVGE